MGSQCKDIHPKGVCSHLRKHGSCPAPSSCTSRHPVKVCFEWEKNGSCNRGHHCHYNHPVELNKNKSFLGQQHRKSQNPLGRTVQSPWLQPQQLQQQSPQQPQLHPYPNQQPQPHPMPMSVSQMMSPWYALPQHHQFPLVGHQAVQQWPVQGGKVQHLNH